MKKRVTAIVLTLIMMFSMSGCGTKSAEPVVAEGLPEFTVHGETDLPGNFFSVICIFPKYHNA